MSAPVPGTPQSAMSGALRSLDNEVADMLKFLKMADAASAHLGGLHGRLHSAINKRGGKTNFNDEALRAYVADLLVALHDVKSYVDKAATHDGNAVNYAWRYKAYVDMHDMTRRRGNAPAAGKGGGS